MKNFMVLALKRTGWSVVSSSHDAEQAIKSMNQSRKDGYEAYVVNIGDAVSYMPTFLLSAVEKDTQARNRDLVIVPNPPHEMDNQ